jgi:DNA-binding NarL/FixJ family response regulator
MNLGAGVILKEDSRARRCRHNERVISVLIADDQELVRTGFRVILEAEGDIEVIAEAENGNEAVRQAALAKPEVVLMDIRMPRVDGLAATRQILDQPDPPKVVILTTFHLDEYVYSALQAGASGFLLKDTPPRQIVTAIRAVAAGSEMLSPAVTRRLIAEYVAPRDHPQRVESRRKLALLSDRERDVLTLIGRGLSNADAAQNLFMSEATIKTYVSRMLTKLELTNRTQAAILAHEAGLYD